MKKSLLFFLVTPFLWMPGSVFAQNLHITLYPRNADVREIQEVTPRNGEIRLNLPAGVETKSLAVLVDGREAPELRLFPSKTEDSPAAAKLRKELESARAGLDALQSELASVCALINFWTSPSADISSPEGLVQTEKLMAEKLSTLSARQLELTRQEKIQSEKLKQMENRLAELTGSGESLAVAVRLPAPEKSVTVTLQYTLQNCGWQAFSRLNALPEQGIVRMTRMAAIEQQTGMDWSNAELTLATVPPSRTLSPAPLRPWNIGAVSPKAQSFARPAAGNMAMLDMATPMASEAVKAPVYQENAVYSSWFLGRKTLPAGEPVQLTLDEQDWPAEFLRVLRPSLQEKSFLAAKIIPQHPISIPDIRADFLVNGILTGKGVFSFQGKEGDVYFGEDPAVTASMFLEQDKSGPQGFLGLKTTRTWNWLIEVANAHASPVKIRLEEPEPQALNENIKISIKSDPAPVTEKHVLIWQKEISAGGKTVIRHQVSYSSPDDVNPGR